MSVGGGGGEGRPTCRGGIFSGSPGGGGGGNPPVGGAGISPGGALNTDSIGGEGGGKPDPPFIGLSGGLITDWFLDSIGSNICMSPGSNRFIYFDSLNSLVKK